MMARRGRCRRWSAAIFLLLMCANISESSPASTPKPDLEEKQCPADYFLNEKGTCCNRCHAGFKLKSECEGEGQKSVCEKCPENQYNDQINHASTCRRCRTCKHSRNEREISSCNATQNAVCGCIGGYYKHHIDSETFECLKCTTCRENETKKQNCTHEGDAVCDCKENYHRVKNKCEPCRNCTPDCAQHCENIQPKVSVGEHKAAQASHETVSTLITT
ncbi:tumor necrosis factor receptor superfamily member 1A [Nematolebias whitei]|uniref:tumor necrosis factor receptor superfamily member 1A n=1 Tax=Nematolebias whitei TaxID=451745 RepID=UPI0018972364|nr:tumor necrosis factor receptor superfamily member 1A [Nematolebias whitei]